MKKFTMKILVIAVLCIVSNGAIAIKNIIVEPYKIYIENHYGAPIKFKTAQPKELATYSDLFATPN